MTIITHNLKQSVHLSQEVQVNLSKSACARMRYERRTTCDSKYTESRYEAGVENTLIGLGSTGDDRFSARCVGPVGPAWRQVYVCSQVPLKPLLKSPPTGVKYLHLVGDHFSSGKRVKKCSLLCMYVAGFVRQTAHVFGHVFLCQYFFVRWDCY